MAKRAKTRSADDRILEAFFDTASEHGWRRLSMAAVARTADLPLHEVLDRFSSPLAVLGHAIDRADRAALSEVDGFTDEDSARDRLFALLMARFDAMQRYRDGIRAILRDGVFDPVLGMMIAARGMCAMMRMLEAAGIGSSGPLGMARAKVLMALNADTLRTWLRDETEDGAKTMAALDKNLGRAEMLARSFDPAARRAASAKATSDTASDSASGEVNQA